MGIRLKSGEWFGFVEDSIYITQLLTPIRACSPDSSVTIDASYKMTTDKEVEKSLAAIHRDRCEIVVKKFALNHTKTRLDLQALTPINPGINQVYRFGDRGVEVALGNYRKVKSINVTSSDKKLLVKFKDGTNSSVWLRKHGDVYDGPNGVFLYNDTLYTTETMIEKTLSLTHSLETMDIIHSEHPLIEEFLKKAKTNQLTIRQKSESTSLDNIITEGAVSLRHKIFEFAFYIVGALIILLVIKKVVNRISCGSIQHADPKVHFSNVQPWNPEVSFIKV